MVSKVTKESDGMFSAVIVNDGEIALQVLLQLLDPLPVQWVVLQAAAGIEGLLAMDKPDLILVPVRQIIALEEAWLSLKEVKGNILLVAVVNGSSRFVLPPPIADDIINLSEGEQARFRLVNLFEFLKDRHLDRDGMILPARVGLGKLLENSSLAEELAAFSTLQGVPVCLYSLSDVKGLFAVYGPAEDWPDSGLRAGQQAAGTGSAVQKDSGTGQGWHAEPLFLNLHGARYPLGALVVGYREAQLPALADFVHWWAQNISQYCSNCYAMIYVPFTMEDRNRQAPSFANHAPTKDYLAETWRRTAQYFFQDLDYGVVAVDAEKKIIVFNKAAESFFQQPKERLLGRYCDEIMAEGYADLCCVLAPLHQGIEVHERLDCSLFFQRKLYLQVDIWKISDAGGDAIGFVGVFRDVTGEINLEEKMHLADKLMVVGQLAAGMAHEIRNPLTTIRGFIQLMRENIPPADRKDHYLSLIMEELDRVNQILQDFLFLAKPHPKNLIEVEITSILNDLCVLVENQSFLNNVNLSKVLNPLPGRVLVDPEQMKQVFLNLIHNAFQAMPGGGELTIKARVEGYFAAVDVIDTGVGIPPELVDKIGEPFFSTKEEGTGLGLSICHQIVRNHGGKIEIESSLGVGSRFTVKLPLIV